MPPDGLMIAIALVSGIGVMTYIVRRQRAMPSAEVMGAIVAAVGELRRNATRLAAPAPPDGTVAGMSAAHGEALCRRVGDAVRLVYTVELEGDGTVGHLISSQLLRPRGEVFQVRCMLVVMMATNRALEAAGITPEDVRFEVSRSPLGTHYVGVRLTADQHARLAAHDAATPGDALPSAAATR